jgi:molybdate transport system substrate-binding protein
MSERHARPLRPDDESRNTQKMRRFLFLRLLACCLLLAGCASASVEQTKQLAVMTSGGFASALEVLAPDFERRTGVTITTIHGSSLGGASDSIPERLKRGERADLVILTKDGLEALRAEGFIREGSQSDLARSIIGLAVKAGQPVPDVSTAEKFIQVLRAAPSIGYSASASGTYLSTELWPRLGLAHEILPKAKRILSERVGAVVARGEVAIGFQQMSELLPIPGITVVGPIPGEFQKAIIYSAAITTDSRATGSAERLLRFLSSPAVTGRIAQTGLEPLAVHPVRPDSERYNRRRGLQRGRRLAGEEIAGALATSASAAVTSYAATECAPNPKRIGRRYACGRERHSRASPTAEGNFRTDPRLKYATPRRSDCICG